VVRRVANCYTPFTLLYFTFNPVVVWICVFVKDGRGFVSVAEMRHLLTSVGEKLTDDEADELLRMSGCVQQGMVQYDSM